MKDAGTKPKGVGCGGGGHGEVKIETILLEQQ